MWILDIKSVRLEDWREKEIYLDGHQILPKLYGKQILTEPFG